MGEMAKDVDERRRATRTQEKGQNVTIICENGSNYRTKLLNSSDGGLAVREFPGAVVGQAVICEDHIGDRHRMEVRWVRDKVVGLQHLVAGGKLSAAA